MHILKNIFEDYKYMVEEFELPVMKETMNQLINQVKEFTKKGKDDSEREIKEFYDSGNVITKDMVSRIKSQQENLK
jgi:hypothetical protein